MTEDQSKNWKIQRRTLIKMAGVAGLFPFEMCAATAPRKTHIPITLDGGRALDLFVFHAVSNLKGHILFSHGYGSAPWHYPAFISAWTHAGYTVHAPLHVDSREHPDKETFNPATNWKARIEDVRATVERIHQPYFAAGHSFGALTALVSGGASAACPDGISLPFVSRLAKAVIALSPPGILPGLVSAENYAEFARPLLLQTGTLDILPGATDPENWRLHLAAFEATRQSNDQQALVLQEVDHYFGGLICDPSRTGPDQRAQLDFTVQATCAFLEAQGSQTAPRYPQAPFAEFLRK